jgi:hypothetical protein
MREFQVVHGHRATVAYIMQLRLDDREDGRRWAWPYIVVAPADIEPAP